MIYTFTNTAIIIKFNGYWLCNITWQTKVIIIAAATDTAILIRERVKHWRCTCSLFTIHRITFHKGTAVDRTQAHLGHNG